MPKRRRVAVAIDIRFGVRHHIDIYAGIHRFAQSADWDHELDPFISVDQRPDRGGRYSGIIARATKQLVGLAARAGIPMVNVWSGSPVVAKVPTVMADYAAGFECTTLRVSGACDETPLAWENYLTRVGKWIAGWRKPLGVFVPQDIYCRFIAEHSHEKISVGDVALHACAAVRSLERHFRAVLGRTVKDEITRLRMERAKRLLVEVDEPIKFIARSCGFSGATYFHEGFIKSEGVTPVAYRRLHVGR